jgi:hypothetical protein
MTFFDRITSRTAGARRTSMLAIIGLVLAAASVLLPAVAALVVSAGAIALGVLARRELKRDQATGPSWVSMSALVVGGFVFVSQAILMVYSYTSR